MDKLKMHSPDITQQNIEKILELFPNCKTEKQGESGDIEVGIDFDLLKQELSKTIVEGPKERYQLNWPGKKEALLAANSPISQTLRPCREESVEFDSTENLFIEGDNLDALKLLQETYLGKVKMIYIDPPYNTGNDFIYADNFYESTDEYLQESGQNDTEGNRLVANTNSNGRFHSDWLTMMFPRLKLARNLLKDDGVIFISIDDVESANLKKLCDEVYGAENFVAQFVWKSRQNKDNRNFTGVSIDHEYVICYSKVHGHRALRGAERKTEQYKNPDNDPRGPWNSGNMVGLLPEDLRPNCHYELVNPKTGLNYGKPEMGWRYDQNTMARLINENRILWPENTQGRPRRKVFLNELSDNYTGFSSLVGADIYTRNGTADLANLFDKKYFDFPKPVELIKDLLVQSLDKGEIVLDFFAGSSTTPHAVMKLNSEDNGRRKFIAVQIPEACAENSLALKAGFQSIADISKQRIRLAGSKIREENPEETSLDVGFRVLKIDSSNMNDVQYTPDSTSKSDLFNQIEHIKSDRSNEDLLFQVMLDWGVDLSLPIRSESIEGKVVYFVNDDDLIACFDQEIDEPLIKALAAFEPLRVVFRDDGFVSDSVKINAEQIFKQLSPSTDIKAI